MEKNKKFNDEYIFEVAFQFHRLGKYYGNTSDTHFTDIYQETIKLINKTFYSMNPKEKAIELFNKFSEIEDSKLDEDAWIDSYLAKRCCLVAVDFAMEFITGDLDEAFDKTLYLHEFKKEIENL